MLKRNAAVLMALAWSTTAVLAQEPAKAPAATPPKETVKEPAKAEKKSLNVGDKAPAISVEKWLKGDQVTAFEKGKVYVVEYWATWCGPCIAAFPHLSELQKEFKDKGLTIIGVNIWEERGRPYNEKTFPKVTDFLAKQADRMSYTVAFDGETKYMDKEYMQAAGRNGIPSAFIVDQNGMIAYIGHPGQMDATLKEVIAGKFDLKAAAQTYKDVKENANFLKEYKAALAGNKDLEQHYAKAAKLIDTAFKNDAQTLNEIAWFMVDPDAKVAKKDLDLALKAAQRGVEVSKEENWAIMDTLARVYFCKGDTAKAIEWQKKALAKAPEGEKAQLEPSLKEYEAAAKKGG